MHTNNCFHSCSANMDDSDKISGLPDELLCHILSFLPTEESVAISILSKRWRSLWLSVPVLNFDNRFSLVNNFERLIRETMLARDPQQPITSFCLNYKFKFLDGKRAEANVNAWVNKAIQHGIENLEINLEGEYNRVATFANFYHYIIRLSCCRIFSCRTLVVLSLESVTLVSSSNSVELPSLKSLHLSHVEFEEPQCLMELLYGCPMLEDLETVFLSYAHKDGSFSKDRFKNFYLPKLVRAEIQHIGMEMDGTKILLKAVSNVEFLTVAIKKYGVDDDVVPEFPHLRRLTLAITNSCLVLLTLKNFPKLQSLKFDGYFNNKDVLPFPHFVPECLTSCLTECYLTDFEGTQSELQLAKYIMQNSTFLRSMKIPILHHTRSKELMEELALCPRKSASCELSFI